MPDDGAPESTQESEKERHSARGHEGSNPVSFLDDTWSWSSPSSWPLSIRFLPVPVACVVLFLGVYLQQLLYALSPLETCIRDFDYRIPIEKIEKLAVDLSTHDWEHGAAAEALLEFYNPEISVFGENPFPNDRIPSDGVQKTKALQYVMPKVQLQRNTLSNNTWGVADPASLGVFAVMAAAEDRKTKQGVVSLWSHAVSHQESYLYVDAPLYANGAISHRTGVAELWSDAIFMFPPFLAYEAVNIGTSNMKQAVKQIGLYRDILLTTRGEHEGSWKHIVGPSDMADAGAWSTGNGWAAYGMARVRATLAAWTPSASLLLPQIASLDSWMAEIIDAAVRTDDHESGLLRNYLGDSSWFGETAGTALIAAATYRLVGFLESGERREKYKAWANQKREAVFAHIDAHGVAKPAVNSLKHAQSEPMDGVNPEGQSFVLLLSAAWRDCVCSGVCEK